jgi:RND family efflux transporter MFP subunit
MPDERQVPPERPPIALEPAPGRESPALRQSGRKVGRRLFGFGVLAILLGSLALGVWQHYQRNRQMTATNQALRDFVPTVQVDEVRASGDTIVVSLPATTLGFETANIFARASGYIAKRLVDIGSQVKAGDLLVQIAAPEIEDQIRQAQATLAQDEATLGQTTANLELARITAARSAALAPQGYTSRQQADTDRLNYQAQQHAAAVAQAAIKAQQAQLTVLGQTKAYQQVVAPFDGVVTQRNIDVGSLVQADAASGTSLFTMVHSEVIRVQLYVPQDDAYGLTPGVDAVVHVPEIPGHDFPGKVTRIADALQPGTRTLLTEIDVANPEGLLRPGIYCTVELKIPRRSPSFVVPGAAIIFNRDGLQVAAVEDGKVHIKKITVVRDLGTEVEASEGVTNGEQVVLNPTVNLAEGSRVEIRADGATRSP